MARPGSGGSSRPSGTHSGSRPSGSHRAKAPSTHSRPGGVRPSVPHSSSSHGTHSYHPTHRPSTPVMGTATKAAGGRGGLIAIIVFFLAIFCIPLTRCSTNDVKNRTPLKNESVFNTDCIEDELGWISSVKDAESGMETFFEKTGIQPYVLLKSYDADYVTDGERQDYADKWYEEHIGDEKSFLFVYFAEEDPNKVGLMQYVQGRQTTEILDADAIDVFWAKADKWWYSDTTDEKMISSIFEETANDIMKHKTSRNDVVKVLLIVAALAGAGYFSYRMVKMKLQRDKEKAEETAQILSTPLEHLSDPLVEQYLDKDGSTEKKSETGENGQ